MEEDEEKKFSVNLPVFYGVPDQDCLTCGQFLFIFESLARVNQWNDAEKLKITSNACLHANFSNCKFLTYEDFKQALLAQCQPQVMNVREKIELRQSLVQEECENVQDFFDRCKSVLCQIDSNWDLLHDNRDLLLTFLQGLKPDLKDIVIKSDAKTLSSFLEAAIKVEIVQTSLKSEVMDAQLAQLDFDGDDDFEDIISDNDDIDEDDEEKPLIDFLVKSELGTRPEEKCNQCGYLTRNLASHAENEHVKATAKLNCDTCSIPFATRKVHNFHLIHTHPELCHKCHDCHQVFTSSTKLASHILAKHTLDDKNEEEDQSLMYCHFCSKEYSNKNSLKAHINAKHVTNKRFSCQVCPKTFSSASNLKTHVRIVHLMERPYECSECGKSYASEGGLSAHQASIHGRGERLQCDKCDMSFPYKSALTTHILNRHNRGTFICDECGAANNTKEALRIHKITDHSEDKGKKLGCPYFPECKERFRVPFQVRNHVKRVHKKVEGTHVCHMCPKKYHSRQRLESHINGVHLNKKPHKCPHCEFASAYQGHVKDHIRASHEAVKYPCPYPMCNHQSSYKGNLDKHIRNIHTKNIEPSTLEACAN